MKKTWQKIATVAGSLALIVVLSICLSACGSSSKGVSYYTGKLLDDGYDVGAANLSIVTSYVSFNMFDTEYWAIEAEKTVVLNEGKEDEETIEYEVTILNIDDKEVVKTFEIVYNNIKKQELANAEEKYNKDSEGLTGDALTAFKKVYDERVAEIENDYNIVIKGNTIIFGTKNAVDFVTAK